MFELDMKYLNLTGCEHQDPSIDESLIHPSAELYNIVIDNNVESGVQAVLECLASNCYAGVVLGNESEKLGSLLKEKGVSVYSVTFDKVIDDIFEI